MKRGKRYERVRAKVPQNQELPLMEACKPLVETASAKFDESVEIAIALSVDLGKLTKT